MLTLYISAFLLYAFGFFNLFGMRPDLASSVLIFGCVGIAIIFVVKSIGIHFFLSNAHIWYGVWVVLLVGLLIFGVDIKGSRRWIELPFFSIQPAEIFKIFFILYIARFLGVQHKSKSSVIRWIIVLLVIIVPIILIAAQPDFSDAFVLVIISIILLLVTNITRRHTIIALIFAVAISPFMWPLLEDYQQQRILSFINQEQDPQGTAYNMIQAIITVGSGGLWGKGLGYGTQTRLAFLPEHHTDFAYASLVEQFGFAGGTAVIVIYSVCIIVLAKKSINLYMPGKTRFMTYFYLHVGVLIFLTIHVIVNIGMNIGILPITGITLPFISYGGSSLLTWAITIGILASVHQDTNTERQTIL